MDVAQGRTEADLIIRNANVVNVFTKKIEPSDVVIAEGVIAWIGPGYMNTRSGKNVIDAQGKFLIPGLIDAHAHIEMSFMSAVPYAQTVISHGTTAAMLDLHDVCNTGIECMHSFAKEIASTPLRAFIMIPPCVPGTPNFEEAGADMTLQHMQEAMLLPKTWGIAEAMDFNRILDKEPEILKIMAWANQKGLRIDGHCPELRGDALQAYLTTGVLTDHESVTLEEMLEKYQLGMKVIIRRGSIGEPVRAGDFIDSLADTSNVLLATDGCIFLDDILEKGSMRRALQLIVAEGVDPITAIQMATINVARAYGFDHKIGSIAPGRWADLVLVKDLRDFDVEMVLVEGKQVDFKSAPLPRHPYPASVLETVKMEAVTKDSFHIPAPIESGEVTVRVMTLQDDSIATKEEQGQLTVENGLLMVDTAQDLLKIAVFDRYRKNGNRALGVVRGFGLKNGAFGGSIGQDSQNLVVVGANDEDMATAVNAIREMQGGVVAVKDGAVLAKVQLPIAGIMSDLEPLALKGAFTKLHACLRDLGCERANPSFDLSLMLTCAVIPELKITNRGLVDALAGQFVPLFK